MKYVYEIILHPSGKPKFNTEEKTLKLIENQIIQVGMTQSCEYSSSLYQIRHIQAHKDNMLHVALELLF